MKNKLNKNLSNIRNFYKLILQEGNASQEEMYNFFQECLVFAFNEYNINVDDFKISFHFVKQENKFEKTHKRLKKSQIENLTFPENTYAMMKGDDVDDTKFDIYFPKKAGSFAIIRPQSHSKGYQEKTIKEDALLNYSDQLSALFDIVFDLMHEIAHIIQYIKTPSAMNDSDYQHCVLQDNERVVKKYMKKCPQKRLFLRALEKYRDVQGYVADYEIDANKKAFEMNKKMVLEIMKNEDEQDLFDLLSMNFLSLTATQRHLAKTYKIKNPIYYDSIKKLSKIYGSMSDTFDELYETAVNAGDYDKTPAHDLV